MSYPSLPAILILVALLDVLNHNAIDRFPVGFNVDDVPILTSLEVPLNWKSLPILPEASYVILAAVPVSPLPEESAALPLLSSNFQYPIDPEHAAVPVLGVIDIDNDGVRVADIDRLGVMDMDKLGVLVGVIDGVVNIDEVGVGDGEVAMVYILNG